MSRIGKQPILIPEGVMVEVNGQRIIIKGDKGECTYTAPESIAVAVKKNHIEVSRTDASKFSKVMFGTVRSLINNIVVGVSQGYRKELIIEGVGHKARIQGQFLILVLGYSHEINYPIPEGVSVEVRGETNIKVEGLDKQLVGQVAARIRSYSPAEPYKRKGIRYSGEQIRRKEGKAVA